MTRRGTAAQGAHRGGLSAADLGGVRGLAVAAHRFDACRRVEEVVEATARAAVDVLGADACAVCRITQETSRVLHVEQTGDDQRRDQALRATYRAEDRPALRALLRNRESWVAHAFDAHGRSVRPGDPAAGDRVEVELLREIGAASALTAPVVVNDVVWGQVTVLRDFEAPLFHADDVATAEVLAALAAGAIARVDLEKQMRHMIADDPLTGLANRRTADQAADAALASGRETCVVMCDVDGLKRVNDELGHDAGDDLLRAVADVLRRAADAIPGATAARIGGDEFCLVTVDQSREAVATAMATTVAKFPLPHGAAISYGIASTAVMGSVEARHLFRRADQAQYQAKRRRARARARTTPPISDPVQAVERLTASGAVAIGAAAPAVVPRLCAFAAAATETLGGDSWAVRERMSGSPTFTTVARGGSPADAAETRTITVERDAWVVEVAVAAAASTGRQVQTALHALVAIAVDGARNA
ncbi:diguanylate cyclase [Cellulomonas sp. B6]|uniref:GGDEF domain-containing protein n=1 Tax=Cellulomonas sp. B6 TaxID=1295626 RepID=UPI00073B93BF|nr:sensor domain-containing diguanylate cyclase [Cellulomonas sp. B6]KSW30011.1 diguanylate cyclase [Cellulomonas sp. B6]